MRPGGDGLPGRLFVYGTLRPDLAPARLRPLVSRLRPLARARLRGVLLDLGAYPAAQLAPGGDVVVGMLVEVDEPALWRALDGYEGYDPARPDESLFVRVRARAVAEDGREHDCQVYVWAGGHVDAPRVPGGDWARRGGQAGL